MHSLLLLVKRNKILKITTKYYINKHSLVKKRLHILKLTKAIVKGIAVVIAMAFFLNSFIGLLGSIEFIENQNINVDPGDIEISYENLFLNVSIGIENNGLYDIKDVLIGVNFSMKSDIVDYTSVLDTNSAVLNSSIPENGQTIPSKTSANIMLEAQLADFDLDPTEIVQAFNASGDLPADWNLVDLVDEGFEVRLQLYFTIAYAFRQFQLRFDIFVDEDVVKASLVESVSS